MRTKISSPYLGTAIALFAMLLPLSSQADVYWSLNLGHGLKLAHGDHRQYHHQHIRKSHKRKHGHHKPKRLRQYYWRHRAYHQRHYYDTNPYGFIPRHRPRNYSRH